MINKEERGLNLFKDGLNPFSGILKIFQLIICIIEIQSLLLPNSRIGQVKDDVGVVFKLQGNYNNVSTA